MDVHTVPSCPTAENCIVIAEGAMQLDGAFHAAALGFPPCEPRENLPMAAQVRKQKHSYNLYCFIGCTPARILAYVDMYCTISLVHQ